jgi:hypothetical protein
MPQHVPADLVMVSTISDTLPAELVFYFAIFL